MPLELQTLVDAQPQRALLRGSGERRHRRDCASSRFLGSFDCGRILNAKTAASQFRGGIIMGLGLALMEETLFDERTGRIMNPSPRRVPRAGASGCAGDRRDLDRHPGPSRPVGARGIGEIGITGVGAVVANAIFNATGKRVRDLPITLDKLM